MVLNIKKASSGLGIYFHEKMLDSGYVSGCGYENYLTDF